MKKSIFAVTLFISSLMLSSCKVNWFGDRFDVPWYFIAIPVILILLVSYIILMRGTYICPECKTEFKPRWYQLSVGFHYGGKRLVKCPRCGKKGFCERKK